MKSTRIWTALLMLLGPCAAGWVSASPLLDCSGLPCVMVKAGGSKEIKLAIDTGNANSFFDKATAAALGMESEPIIGGDGKPMEGLAKAHVKSLDFGGVSLEDLVVLVGDLKAEKAKGTVPDVDGTIAYTAFKDRVLTLDYRGNSVTLS